MTYADFYDIIQEFSLEEDVEKPWISAYEPKRWTVYTPRLDSGDYEMLRQRIRGISDKELMVCAAESEMAARCWKSSKSIKGMFYYDMEQLLGMDLDKVFGGSLGILTKEWKGHPAGSLAFITYNRVDEEPRRFTIGIAPPLP